MVWQTIQVGGGYNSDSTLGSEMTYNMLMGTLNPTNSLIHDSTAVRLQSDSAIRPFDDLFIFTCNSQRMDIESQL